MRQIAFVPETGAIVEAGAGVEEDGVEVVTCDTLEAVTLVAGDPVPEIFTASPTNGFAPLNRVEDVV